ncbi:nitroreductase [Sphingomonas donggukensis]|uniref:Putative NAD(P)H nitroreductase n=1 Tax=Sphingomonas donggukensis TaxID=2949093 RepID=A0ABY4TVT0_9SPHN|nr:nitroreductase [Sphingomonas donggukensis]URW75826.1 nitroreductase [Sphingomonas donggukensis]
MFNDLATPLTLLATRRSGKPRDMIAPGPNDAELDAILAIAARVPDHGKLGPWRFVVVGADQREAFARVLTDALLAEKPDAGPRDIEAAEQFANQAPALVVVLSAPIPGHKIPQWEQELSAGAACMQLLNAATAHGYAGGWLTGWAAYSPRVRDAFGAAPERIAGFIFLGTPARPLEERPRPDLQRTVTRWQV